MRVRASVRARARVEAGARVRVGGRVRVRVRVEVGRPEVKVLHASVARAGVVGSRVLPPLANVHPAVHRVARLASALGAVRVLERRVDSGEGGGTQPTALRVHQLAHSVDEVATGQG